MIITTKEILFFFDIIGLLAFAFSGALKGISKKLDILGIAILGIVTALGGGIIRDLLVGEIPRSLKDIFLIDITLIGILLAAILYRVRPTLSGDNKLLLIFDGIGLGAFTVTGAVIGTLHGLNIFGVILLAFLTAVGGGILRDLLVNDVPMILYADFYASISILGAIFFTILNALHIDINTNAFLTALFVIILRLFAIILKWKLPKIHGPTGY